MALIESVAQRGAFIMQAELREFETKLAQFCNCKHAIGVANATDGLHLIARALEIGTGDEVIFCSHTMTATAAAIKFTGATPVPVDCKEDHLIDPQSIKSAITPKTKAILPTQLNGRTCAMDPILEIAEDNNLLIIEDSAQALGSKYNGKHAGTFGVGGVFSFYPAKTLGCLGDGGAVVTNSDELSEKIRLLQDHGRNEKGETVLWGINSRLDNIQAAILSYRLDNYETVIERRREIAKIYQSQLEDLEQLLLPPGPDSNQKHFDIFQNYEIEADKRDELKVYLKDNGIGTLIQWNGKPVHQIECYNFKTPLPHTDKVFERCLMLPMNISLTNDDVNYVCDKIRNFYSK